MKKNTMFLFVSLLLVGVFSTSTLYVENNVQVSINKEARDLLVHV